MKTDNTSTDSVGTLVGALAEKGTPGIILLAIIFLTIWAPVTLIVLKFFGFLGTVKDLSEISLAGPLLGTAIIALLGIGYVFMAYRLTSKIMSVMIPTIKAEAEAAVLMAKVLGGRVMTSAGTWDRLAIDRRHADTRTKEIVGALLERAKSILGIELVRSNIFTLHEDGRLRVLRDFHFNMRGRTPDDQELTISIPNGSLSSGRAFKYFRPVLSVKSVDGKWPYADVDVNVRELENEVAKAHPELKWITSMPIPYQVQPFKLVCGVLNIDGLESLPDTTQLQELLADLSAAAALIGVLNRSTGFLEGVYSSPSEPTSAEKEQLKGYMIDPKEFDPASCPEPSEEFILALSIVKGLEFLSQISPAMVASYLRDQLQS